MEEGATEEGEVDDWFAERSPSMSVLVVMLAVVLVVLFLFLLLELIVLFCELYNMSIMLGEGAYGAGGDVMMDKRLLSLLTISILTYMSLGKSERSGDVRDFSSYGSL